MSPETTYISALFGVLALILWAGAVDVTLWARSEMTVSAWLRINPQWAYWPIALVLVAVGGLVLHLFVYT